MLVLPHARMRRYSVRCWPSSVRSRLQDITSSDGKYVGDWKRGEQIAQRGTGFQWSDAKDTPVGANCYACHQISKEEISYGTIGPSLYNFGKLRGYGPEMQKYAWGKIWNAEAYLACSFMPRFGHQGILTEAQVQDVVALLMDPASPVNK